MTTEILTILVLKCKGKGFWIIHSRSLSLWTCFSCDVSAPLVSTFPVLYCSVTTTRYSFAVQLVAGWVGLSIMRILLTIPDQKIRSHRCQNLVSTIFTTCLVFVIHLTFPLPAQLEHPWFTPKSIYCNSLYLNLSLSTGSFTVNSKLPCTNNLPNF